MLVLVLTVCLFSAPADCKDVHLTYATSVATPQQCIRLAMPAMARWQHAHPRRFVRKFRCVPAERLGKKA